MSVMRWEDMKGIELEPIRLRNSLCLLVPMEVAKLIGVTKETKFLLTLSVSEESKLEYTKLEEDHDAQV